MVCPVTNTNAICIEKESKDQNPPDQYLMTSKTDAFVNNNDAINTKKVKIVQKIKGSATIFALVQLKLR